MSENGDSLETQHQHQTITTTTANDNKTATTKTANILELDDEKTDQSSSAPPTSPPPRHLDQLPAPKLYPPNDVLIAEWGAAAEPFMAGLSERVRERQEREKERVEQSIAATAELIEENVESTKQSVHQDAKDLTIKLNQLDLKWQQEVAGRHDDLSTPPPNTPLDDPDSIKAIKSLIDHGVAKIVGDIAKFQTIVEGAINDYNRGTNPSHEESKADVIQTHINEGLWVMINDVNFLAGVAEGKLTELTEKWGLVGGGGGEEEVGDGGDNDHWKHRLHQQTVQLKKHIDAGVTKVIDEINTFQAECEQQWATSRNKKREEMKKNQTTVANPGMVNFKYNVGNRLDRIRKELNIFKTTVNETVEEFRHEREEKKAKKEEFGSNEYPVYEKKVGGNDGNNDDGGDNNKKNSGNNNNQADPSDYM